MMACQGERRLSDLERSPLMNARKTLRNASLQRVTILAAVVIVVMTFGCSTESKKSSTQNGSSNQSAGPDQGSEVDQAPEVDQNPTFDQGMAVDQSSGFDQGAGSDQGSAVDQGTSPAPVASVCTPDNQGICECSDEPGFTTYTVSIADQQRCFTTFVPTQVQTKVAVMITHNCYAENELGPSGCREGSGIWRAANDYGFAFVCSTSTDGNWEFGNDGVANDDNPAPCNEEDSKDILYLKAIFATLKTLDGDGLLDADRVFAEGFSQNGMFAGYTNICFPGQVSGAWQGGSGIFQRGVTDPLPQMEGACRRSDFLEHGPDCVDLTPCDECQYFPVYPVATTPPRKACIMAYEDDFLFGTAEPMYELMTAEGHDATLLQFADIGRGHAGPLNGWAWKVGCLGLTDACAPECSTAFAGCFADRTPREPMQKAQAYAQCFDRGRYTGLDGCVAQCAPTPEMLRLVESPCWVDGVCDADESPASCPRDCL
jgi:hypothetical protein